jgi:ATP-dependent DNA helicase PIF1
MKICARLQELALQAERPNPVFRAAPTRIAAFNINGKTLHSLLRLPIKNRQADLSPSTLQALQLHFRYRRFLIINEKSMIDLKTLSLIDDCLRAILPHNATTPFGGISVLLCGDFFQLPLVGGQALYSFVCVGPDIIKGQHLYRKFDRTIWLIQIIQQWGDNNISVHFRAALGELREGRLSKEGWELFCTRVTNQLSPNEVSTFNNALRLYFTRDEVNN